MDIEAFRNYCLSKTDAEETFPFGPDTLVYKVKGKIFAITGLDSDVFDVNLKCDPQYALELRDTYPEVRPGFHMNKKHWNTVTFDGEVSDAMLKSWIDHSYDLVSGVKKKRKGSSSE
jgi:predicted DNA-binding protein (MmcQ/YjbR family)